MYDYQAEIQALWPISFSMMTGGMHIDVPALIQTRKDVIKSVSLCESRISDMLGWVPNTKSPIDMGRLLRQYNVPYKLQPKCIAKTCTCEQRGVPHKPEIKKETLLTIGAHNPSARPVLTQCVEITSRRTLASNFLGMALDQRDYYHPVYKLNGTKTGRFASEGADEGGPQGQNWPSHLRNIVIADDPINDELTSADLKQAEAMFVAYDSQDIFWIRCFEQKKDAHNALGLILFHNYDPGVGLPSNELLVTIQRVCDVCKTEGLSECTHSQRFISKSSGYAFKYGMGPRKYVTKQLPPAGVFMSEAEGRRIRNKVVTPALGRWQQAGDTALRQSRWQVNALGRKREFYGILDNSGELVREFLSWKAQSVINVITSRAMIKFDKLSSTLSPKPRIVTTTHDSLLINHRKEQRNDVHEMLREAYHQPIPLHGRELNIPLDIGSGPNWRATK
jgi:DNA polymerase I-like protein with 3'-5' exonuclease and polymerase domains